MDNKKQITKLKDTATAYKVAVEYDYFPGKEKYKEVVKRFGKISKSVRDEWEGNCAYEIANGICRLIGEL